MEDKLSSPDSEMLVLGSMILSSGAVSHAVETLSSTDFYISRHRLIFSAACEHYREDRPVDVSLLSETLRMKDSLEKAGGILYLTGLAQKAGVGHYIESHCEIVREKSLLRRLISTSEAVIRSVVGVKAPGNILLEGAQKAFFVLGRHRDGCEAQLCDLASPNSEFLLSLEERVNNYAEHGVPVGFSGVHSGFSNLDKIIDGFGNGHLVVVASRPGVGKTAFAVNLLMNMAKADKGICMFNLEMTSDQLMMRIASSSSGISSDKLKMGNLTEAEHSHVKKVLSGFLSKKIVFDDSTVCRISDICSRARRMKEAHGVDCIIIDYMQLIHGDREYDSRVNEVGKISTSLKLLARELDIPIICLAQLSRKVEERASKVPVLSDLRESGSIEQDADLILFLTRPSLYNENVKPGVATVMVAKNRHGKTGSSDLLFNGNTSTFKSLGP
jgi:replicative DNA helicase